MTPVDPSEFAHRLRRELAEGKSLDDSLAVLRREGASIILSITALALGRGDGLGKAKHDVSGSLVWEDVLREHDKGIEEICQQLESENISPEKTT